jgi:hypothetical protein
MEVSSSKKNPLRGMEIIAAAPSVRSPFTV